MNDLGGFFVFFWMVAIPVLLVGYVVWSGQKKQLGNIRCKRCNHVGPAQGLFLLFRGIKPVCANCQSEDWSKVWSKAPFPANRVTDMTRASELSKSAIDSDALDDD